VNSVKGGSNGRSSRQKRKTGKSGEKREDEKEGTEKENAKKGWEKKDYVTPYDSIPPGKKKKMIRVQELDRKRQIKFKRRKK
jgi:hypothetical protein